MSEHEELLGRLDDCAAIRAIGNGQSERNTFAEAAAAIRKLEAERDEAMAERDALCALLKEAGEAVEPFFVNVAEALLGKSERAADTPVRVVVTAEQFDRARTLLTKIKGDGK